MLSEKKMLDYEDESSSSGAELTPKKNGKSTVSANPQQQQQQPSLLSSLRSVLIVLSTALICFAAARNSITWLGYFKVLIVWTEMSLLGTASDFGERPVTSGRRSGINSWTLLARILFIFGFTERTY